MTEWTPLIVALLAFGAMGGLAYVAGQYYLRAVKLRQRLPVPQNAGRNAEVGGNIARLVARHFDEKRFGVDDTLRGTLRLNLVRAGYFRNDAVNFYVLWRVVTVILLPVVTYLMLELLFPNAPLASRIVIIAISIVLGVMGPDAFI